MALLGLLQAGGSVLGQAMEKVTGGHLLSMLLIACAFTLSLVYLLRLATGHLTPLPAGAVRAPPGVRDAGRGGSGGGRAGGGGGLRSAGRWRRARRGQVRRGPRGAACPGLGAEGPWG